MLPSSLAVGGVQDKVAALLASAPVTVMEKAGSVAVAFPSVTRMTMFECVASSVGVPERRPVSVLNVAQIGLFSIWKVSVSPSASLAAGVNV